MDGIDIGNVRLFALAKHAGQTRWNGDPYFLHVERVANSARQIALESFNNLSDVAFADRCEAAGYLHDVIEDCAVDYDDVERLAGSAVAIAVAAVSDDKRLPAEKRHIEYCIQLRDAPIAAQIVKLADLIDNSGDLLKNLPDVRSLHKLVKLTTWYMRAIEAAFSLHQVRDHPKFKNLVLTFQNIGNAIEGVNRSADVKLD